MSNPTNQWQDISSAPKDGTKVLIWREPWKDSVEGYNLDEHPRSGESEGWFTSSHHRCEPTHWHPKPEPPSAAKEKRHRIMLPTDPPQFRDLPAAKESEVCGTCGGARQLAVWGNRDIVPCHECDPDNPDCDPDNPGLKCNQRDDEEAARLVAAIKGQPKDPAAQESELLAAAEELGIAAQTPDRAEGPWEVRTMGLIWRRGSTGILCGTIDVTDPSTLIDPQELCDLLNAHESGKFDRLERIEVAAKELLDVRSRIGDFTIAEQRERFDKAAADLAAALTSNEGER